MQRQAGIFRLAGSAPQASVAAAEEPEKGQEEQAEASDEDFEVQLQEQIAPAAPEVRHKSLLVLRVNKLHKCPCPELTLYTQRSDILHVACRTSAICRIHGHVASYCIALSTC